MKLATHIGALRACALTGLGSCTLLLSHHPQDGGTIVQKRDFPKVRDGGRVLIPPLLLRTAHGCGMEGWRTGQTTDMDLGPLASTQGSGHSAVSYLRTHSHSVCLIEAYLCSMLTLPESSYKVHFCHAHLHQRPTAVTMSLPLPPTLFWTQSCLIPVIPGGLLIHTQHHLLQAINFEAQLGPVNTCSPVVGCAPKWVPMSTATLRYPSTD